MNIKRLFNIITLMVAAAPCFAQVPATPVQVTMGAEYRVPDKHDDAGFLALPAGGFLQLSQRKDESLAVQKLDARGVVVMTANNPLTDNPEHCETQAVIQMGNKVWWIYAVKDKEKGGKPGDLFAHQIDVNTCRLTGSRMTLASGITPIKQENYYRLPQLGITMNWQFTKSPDNRKLLVWCNKRFEDGDNRQNGPVTFFVFDEQLNKIWSSQAAFPYPVAKYTTRPYVVTNDGAVYTTIGIYNEPKNFKQVIPSRFELFKWSPNQPAVNIPVSVPTRITGDAIVATTDDGTLYVAGCYSRARTEPAEGLFLYRYNATDSTLQKLSDTSMYSYRQLKVSENDRKAGSMPPAATPTVMRFRSLRKEADGSIYLLAQEQYDEVFSTGTTLNNRDMNPHGGVLIRADDKARAEAIDESSVNHYDDIVAACLQPGGGLKWITAIPQKHAGRGIGNSLNFGSYIIDKTCYLLYMSNRRNLKRDEGDELVQHMDGADDAYLTVAAISNTGAVTKEALMTDNDDRKNFDAAGLIPLDGKKIMIRAYGGHLEKADRLQLDALTLPE